MKLQPYMSNQDYFIKAFFFNNAGKHYMPFLFLNSSKSLMHYLQINKILCIICASELKKFNVSFSRVDKE